MQVCAGAKDRRVGQHKIASNWVALYNAMNERILHDPELRLALSLDNEMNEQGNAEEDEEGGLNAAQWRWIDLNRQSLN